MGNSYDLAADPHNTDTQPDYEAFRAKASENLAAAATQDLHREWGPARQRDEVSLELPDSAFTEA